MKDATTAPTPVSRQAPGLPSVTLALQRIRQTWHLLGLVVLGMLAAVILVSAAGNRYRPPAGLTRQPGSIVAQCTLAPGQLCRFTRSGHDTSANREYSGLGAGGCL